MLIKFGDIFGFNEKDFVFLAKTEDIVYAAEVLNMDQSRQFKVLCDKVAKNSKESYKLKQQRLYCFVELKTKSFEERIAYYGRTERNDTIDLFNDIKGSLDKSDLAELHKELIADDEAVSGILKEKIKDIEIS